MTNDLKPGSVTQAQIVDDKGEIYRVDVHHNTWSVIYRVYDTAGVKVAGVNYDRKLRAPTQFSTKSTHQRRGIAKQVGALIYQAHGWSGGKDYPARVTSKGRVLHKYWANPPTLNTKGK